MKQLIDIPLVCICIPNFNNADTISETLDSLINQTYKNLLIKIFDNASTDNSMEILREYERLNSNVKVFQSPNNIGAEANFTKCIQNMTGVYSAIYHSDDVYSPQIVEKSVSALTSKNISAVFTNGIIIDGNNKWIRDQPLPKEFEDNDGFFELSFRELIKSNMKHDNFLICPSAMTTTKTYKEVIKVWDCSKYKTAADIDVWLRFAKLNNIGVIADRLIKYRLAENSFSFRRLKTRVTSKDYFLVMDDYISRVDVKKYLNENDYNNYNFLKFKDTAVIERNCIIGGLESENQIKVNFAIVKQGFTSPKKLMYLCAGLVFKIINHKKILSKLVHLFKG